MKLQDINKLNLSEKTKSEIEVNVAELIVDDEFNKDNNSSYREDAVERLLKLDLAFVSEQNIIYELVKRFFKIVNPLTGKEMKLFDAVSSGSNTTFCFRDEETNASMSFTMNNDALRFSLKGE